MTDVYEMKNDYQDTVERADTHIPQCDISASCQVKRPQDTSEAILAIHLHTNTTSMRPPRPFGQCININITSYGSIKFAAAENDGHE